MSPLFSFLKKLLGVFMKTKTIVRKYQLKSSKQTGKGKIKIAFLTDIHNCVNDEEAESIFRILEKAEPNVVLVGGDVILGKQGADIEVGIRFINGLSKMYPVIYANGNHEQRISLHPEKYGDMGMHYEHAIAQTGVTRLINQKVELTVEGIPITVYGLDVDEKFYEKDFHKKSVAGELQKAFGKPDQNRYTILLSHTPRYANDYLAWGADLILSGHYHGGVMLLSKKRGLVTPDFHIFSPLCCGIRSRGNSNMIISAGLGEHTIPVRIRNPREVTIVDIESL